MALSLDKHMSKALAEAQGLRTPDWLLLREAGDLDDIGLDYPLFVKPNSEGSSMGIRRSSLVQNAGELHERAEWVLDNYPQGCLVEEFLPGREFCAGFLGNESLRELPVVELRTEEGFYPYEDKSRHRKELQCPADISAELRQKIVEMGRRAYRIFGCRDFGRVDIKLDDAGQPHFIEINPLPGLSPDYSIFTRQARAAGISFEQTIGRIIDAALNRYGPTKGG
jgi:D-alanine-D-alanine ligase